MSENVPVYGIVKERTAEFTTLEKEYKRGFSRHPPKQFRLECENVIQSSRPSTVSTAGSEKDEQDDLQQNVEFRQKQNENRTTGISSKMSDEDDDEDEEEGESGSTSTDLADGSEPSTR